MNADRFATLIGLLVVFASVVASWSVLSERTEISRGQITNLEHTQNVHTDKIKDLKADKTVEFKLIELERKIDRLSWQLEQLPKRQR